MGLASALKAGQTVVELGKDAQSFRKAASDFRSADKGDMGRQAGHQAFNKGADTGKEMGKAWLKTFETIPRFVCRGLQFILALVACGFYGNRVDADRKADDGFSPEWIFAIFVAGISAVSAFLLVVVVPLGALPFIGSRFKIARTHRAFAWDLTMFVMWLVVFGIFAGIFLKRDSDEPYKGSSTGAMKTAVWVDLVNAILWLISGTYGAIKTFVGEKANSLTNKMGTKLFSKKNKETPSKDMEMDTHSDHV